MAQPLEFEGRAQNVMTPAPAQRRRKRGGMDVVTDTIGALDYLGAIGKGILGIVKVVNTGVFPWPTGDV